MSISEEITKFTQSKKNYDQFLTQYASRLLQPIYKSIGCTGDFVQDDKDDWQNVRTAAERHQSSDKLYSRLGRRSEHFYKDMSGLLFIKKRG